MASPTWSYRAGTRHHHHAGARRNDRADAPRPLREDGGRDAPRRHGHDRGFRQCGAALPGPARPDRRAGHADLAAARRADQRVGRGAARLAHRGSRRSIGIMCRNHRGFVEAVVAANRIGADVVLLNTSFAGPAMADVVNREGVDAVIYDEEFTATVDRALADKPDATRIVAWTDDRPRAHRREAHRRPRRATARAHRPQGQDDPADLRHHRISQGRQAIWWRRRHRHAQGDPGPHAVAGRGDHRDRRADVPRVGLFAIDLRRVDGLHGGHPAQVRPGSHAGPRRPPPGDRPCRGAGDVRPHHGSARRDPKPLQRHAHCASRRHRVRGCGPTSSPRSWTSSAT